MTTDSTNRMNSFIHQFDFIEESLMDFVLETVLRLGALTETRLFLIVEGKNGRQFCGHRDYVSAFKSGELQLDSSKDDEVELDSATTRKSLKKRLDDNGGVEDGTKLERLKRKMPTGSVETSQVGVEKKIRLTNEVVDDTIATSDVVNDVTSVISTSIIGDDSFLVKQEREQDLYLDSNRIVTKSCSSNAVGSLSHTAFETLSPVGLPRVKVLKEIEDPSESGENSPFTSGLTPEECSDPSGGLTTAFHDGVPLKVYKHRCDMCYKQSDCFIEGAIPKQTVKILLPWCNQVAVVRHRGEQCYPCPDCEREAVSSVGSVGIIQRNEEIRIQSWENISSRLHTRLRQHYARHHHCFLNQVYKTPDEVKEFYITARKIRCQMIHGPSPRICSSL